MPTTLDITIPYNGGSIGSVAESNLYEGNGNHYTWIGGDNGRKFISIRVQGNPNFIFLNVLEVDDLRSSAMQFSTLSSEAFTEYPAPHGNHVRVCRLNSNTALIKFFQSSNTASGKVYVVEVDESDNSVTYHKIPVETETQGGMYSPTSTSLHADARALHCMFMQQIKDNSIVSYESTNNNSQSRYTFCQKTWDPVAKTLTSKIITPSQKDANILQRVTTPFTADQPHHIVSDYTGDDPQVESIFHPVLHGSASGNWGTNWDSQGYSFFINSVEGRDGKIHFSLGWRSTVTGWQVQMVDRSDSRYVITYDPSDDSWTTTSRRAEGGNSLSNNRQDLGIWLPLNTVKTKEYYAAHHPTSSNLDNFDDKQLHAKSWIVIGAKSAKVVGSESGSEIVISDSNNSFDDAYQAMWLDEDHFVVFYILNAQNNNVASNKNNIKYTVVRYYDEHYMESVSEGTVNSDSYVSYLGQPLFRKVDDYTLVSDAFSRVVSFWAPEA